MQPCMHAGIGRGGLKYACGPCVPILVESPDGSALDGFLSFSITTRRRVGLSVEEAEVKAARHGKKAVVNG
jgi:hypothetical protein